jgi:hypothetical protein
MSSSPAATTAFLPTVLPQTTAPTTTGFPCIARYLQTTILK